MFVSAALSRPAYCALCCNVFGMRTRFSSSRARLGCAKPSPTMEGNELEQGNEPPIYARLITWGSVSEAGGSRRWLTRKRTTVKIGYGEYGALGRERGSQRIIDPMALSGWETGTWFTIARW